MGDTSRRTNNEIIPAHNHHTLMDKLNLRTITNNFLDVRLLSLASWHLAHEISPRDHGGPYVVLQEGYDPGMRK